MKLVFIILVLTTGTFAHALDAASQEALSKTQQLLSNPAERAEAISKDAGAKAADDKLKAIPGLSAADQQKAYEISAQIMATLVQQTGGDVTKQKQLIEEAARDPQAFLSSLPTDQRSQIEALSKKAESQAAH